MGIKFCFSIGSVVFGMRGFGASDSNGPLMVSKFKVISRRREVNHGPASQQMGFFRSEICSTHEKLQQNCRQILGPLEFNCKDQIHNVIVEKLSCYFAGFTEFLLVFWLAISWISSSCFDKLTENMITVFILL